eukprot:gene10924-7581_t
MTWAIADQPQNQVKKENAETDAVTERKFHSIWFLSFFFQNTYLIFVKLHLSQSVGVIRILKALTWKTRNEIK